jgi:hypothetical protein
MREELNMGAATPKSGGKKFCASDLDWFLDIGAPTWCNRIFPCPGIDFADVDRFHFSDAHDLSRPD